MLVKVGVCLVVIIGYVSAQTEQPAGEDEVKDTESILDLHKNRTWFTDSPELDTTSTESNYAESSTILPQERTSESVISAPSTNNDLGVRSAGIFSRILPTVRNHTRFFGHAPPNAYRDLPIPHQYPPTFFGHAPPNAYRDLPIPHQYPPTFFGYPPPNAYQDLPPPHLYPPSFVGYPPPNGYQYQQPPQVLHPFKYGVFPPSRFFQVEPPPIWPADEGP